MADGPVPDTAMDTKSEESLPDSADATPLTEDERGLLDRLRDGAGTGGPAAEDSPAYAAAVEAGAPVPIPPPAGGADPLDPVFREPPP